MAQLTPGHIYRDTPELQSYTVYLRFVRARKGFMFFHQVSGPEGIYEKFLHGLVYIKEPEELYEVRPTEIDHLTVKHLIYN